MRWLLVPFLALATSAFAGGKGADGCTTRCSDRMAECTKTCKNGACVQRCGDQMQKCAGNCTRPDAPKDQGPEPKPGHMPRPSHE